MTGVSAVLDDELVIADFATREIDLDITGMTCASCVGRVEKKLNALNGVTATVNLPLESAHIVAPADITDEQLIAAVQKAGYEAALKNNKYRNPGRAMDSALPPKPVLRDSRSCDPQNDGGRETTANRRGFETPLRGSSTDGIELTNRHPAASEANTRHPAASVGGSQSRGPREIDAGDFVGREDLVNAPTESNALSENALEFQDAVALDLEESSSHRGYAGDIDLAGRALKTRLIVASILALPVLVISMIMPFHFPGWEWVVAGLSLPVATWAAWPFHRAAFKAARHGTSTMDTLVSLGVIAAMVWSFTYIIRGGTHVDPGHGQMFAMPNIYFEVAAVVVAFLLAGRFAEHRARRKAGDALRALLNLGAKHADQVALDANGEPIRNADGGWAITRVPVSHLLVGDVFAVTPGAIVATDGEVIFGNSAIDASLVTGESVPIEVTPGTAVVGGTINTDGFLLVRATAVGADTALARISALVAAAQTGKAPIARLGDKISAVFVPIVLAISILTFIGWLIVTGDVNNAFMTAVAVLIIACPCALGLATPTAILVGTGRGAQLGVLIKGPEILELTRTVDTIVLDKTGTVTMGKLAVDAVTAPGAPQEVAAQALAYAAAVEALSEHPVAQAIVAKKNPSAVGSIPSSREEPSKDGVSKPRDGEMLVTDFVNAPGGGVRGVINGTTNVAVGQLSWLERIGVTISTEIETEVARAEARGATTVVVAWDDRGFETASLASSTDGRLVARAVIALIDPPKASSAAAIAELKALGLRPILLTGDSLGAAQAAAKATGIAEQDVIARVQPTEKAATVTRLQQEGRRVAMVGDGVNDAAALASADLGLAMGTGTDAAMAASDITLVTGDLQAAASAIRLSRQTLRIIKQNLFWAFAYNALAIPLAAAGLLNPMIAGGAMALSSVLVVSNSLRLRRFR